MRKFLYVLLLCWQIVAISYAEPADRYPFEAPGQQADFYQLLKQLRCLVCQNQDLSDSNAALAEDLRREVYNLMLQGNDKAAVLAYVTDRYGDFVLFKPPLQANTYILWLAPFGLLLVTLAVLLYWIRRRNRQL